MTNEIPQDIEMSPEIAEREVLINRYIYYVLGSRIISDMEYDCLEDYAREILPEESIVNDVGSSNEDDYSEDIKEAASTRLEELKKLLG